MKEKGESARKPPRGAWRVTELGGGDPGKIKGKDQWPGRLEFLVSPPGL